MQQPEVIPVLDCVGGKKRRMMGSSDTGITDWTFLGYGAMGELIKIEVHDSCFLTSVLKR